MQLWWPDEKSIAPNGARAGLVILISMQPRLVMFDMAGTTLFDRGDMARVLSQLFADQGLELSPGRFGAIIGLPLKTVILQGLQRTADPRAEDKSFADNLFRESEVRLADHFRSRAVEVPGAMRVMDLIKRNGAFIVLDTGLSRPVAEAALERLNWHGGVIDLVITSNDVNRPKPLPDMVLHAMRSLGVENPKHVASVGGTPQDLIMGSTGGCGWNIGVTEGNFTRESLIVYPHSHLVANITQVPEILLD